MAISGEQKAVSKQLVVAAIEAGVVIPVLA
jgi:hypothetical protein